MSLPQTFSFYTWSKVKMLEISNEASNVLYHSSQYSFGFNWTILFDQAIWQSGGAEAHF